MPFNYTFAPIAIWLALAPVALAQADLPDAPDVLVITGERPGPGLWKATRDGHTLWLLGTLQPLPLGMSWRSAQVERVLAKSQQVIPGRIGVKVDGGPFSLLGLYLKIRKASRIADGRHLADVMEPAQHARFEALRQRYAPREDLESLRPILAAEKLYEGALKSAGLGAGPDIEKAILKAARADRVAIAENTLRIDNPKALLAEVDRIPMASELKCLAATMDRIEQDLPTLRSRAAAWATGDVEALKAMKPDNRHVTCWDVASLSPGLNALIQAQSARRIQQLDAARLSNESTLVLVAMDQILAPTGALATLKAMGYEVEEPR